MVNMYEKGTVRVEKSDGIATMYFDNPPVNAIELKVLDDLDQALSYLEADEAVRAVVFTGTGDCLSAGLDLKVIPGYNPAEQRQLVEAVNSVVLRIFSLPVPTVVAANGHAIAGGFIILMAFDYRVCTSSPCQLGVTESRLGIPFPIATLEVVRSGLAPQVSRRLMLTGITIGPEEALAGGVVDELQPPELVLPRAQEMASYLAGLPHGGYAKIKRQLREETITLIEEVIAAGDPLLKTWIDAEAAAASIEHLADEP
jgi:enoyl-CoA hydratase